MCTASSFSVRAALEVGPQLGPQALVPVECFPDVRSGVLAREELEEIELLLYDPKRLRASKSQLGRVQVGLDDLGAEGHRLFEAPELSQAHRDTPRRREGVHV